jgi:hypothetical protein
MAITPKVRVEITAIDRATATIKGVSNQISGISSGLMKLGAAYATVRMGFAIFEQFTTKVADYGESILIASQKTGMTTEQISALRFAAGQDRIEFDALTKSLGIFSRNLVGLGGKGKDTEQILQAMGVASRNAGHEILPMHDLLLSVAERFSKMADGAKKNAIATALFGKSGADLIPFLNQGASAIGDLEKQAKKLGITLDEKSAKAADAFGDQMGVLKEMIHGVALKIGTTMMPKLLEWTIAMENAYPLVKRLGYGLEFLAFAFITVAKGTTFQFAAMEDFWTLAQEALDNAAAAEAEYNAGVSASTASLQARLTALKALGDVDEFGGPEKEKKAKSRKSDLGEYITLLRELRPELEGIDAVERHYSEVLQRIAQLTGQYDDALLLRLAREEKAKGVTAAMLEEQRKLQESLKAPLTLPADLLTSAQTMQGQVIPAFHEAGFAAHKFGEEMSHAFTQMIVFGRGGIDMLKSMVAMLVEAILKAFAFKQIYLSLGGARGVAGGGVGGFFAGFFGGLAGLQGGGTVSAGTPYLVGEAGPEMFVPETAGAIVSNSEIGGNSIVYNIDARGADPSVELRIRRALREVHRDAVETAERNIHERSWRAGA